ncbi:MAG: hypothetical protein V4649_07355 [Bacteroidota bacterium]
MKYAVAEFKKLAIWKQFDQDKSVNFDIETIFFEKLYLLDLYYKAFPKYTLHNSQHQYNILKIIGDVLGTSIKKLTKLECAILILSAVFHDIGMVFNESQLELIAEEEHFKEFLNNNLKAKIKFSEKGNILSGDIAEWYCRWVHAKRVWLFLDELDKNKWRSISIKNPLGHVCESHNSDVTVLSDDLIFETNYLNSADLKFCAILLRIADILDFDNSRSPKSVYEFLNLENPKSQGEQISKEEWTKHLCSDGFSFDLSKKTLQLSFVAGPEHPQIEYSINNFLSVIEDELVKCNGVLPKCSERWRDFRLPFIIDRSGIKSLNYKKGDYRLSLEEGQIIKLLTGENLYDNDFVFIRELLQNAIDTSRMRQYHECSAGNTNFIARPIDINSWTDSEGYRWVRIDDFGMGINEYVIQNHLLKKGNSYYSSDFFRIQQIHYKEKTQQTFTPISRFGIGLLSCYILGDSIEINTRSIEVIETNSPEQKHRISIQALQGQCYVQAASEKHTPLPMPHQRKQELGYRKEFGTTIAVRICRSKDFLEFEDTLEKILNEYLMFSPVAVYFNSKKVGLDLNILNGPLTEEKFYPFSVESKHRIEKAIGKQLKSDIGLSLLPINLSRYSNSANLKGQLVFCWLRCDDFISSLGETYHMQFDLYENETFIFSSRLNNSKQKRVTIENESAIVEAIRKTPFFHPNNTNTFSSRENLVLIHNGITIPNTSTEFPHMEKISLSGRLFSYEEIRSSHNCWGIIYLQDDLLPNVSVARNNIKRIGFNIYSNLCYALRQLNNHIRPENYFDFFEYIMEDNYSLQEVRNDQLVRDNVWNKEKIVRHNGKFLSILDLKAICIRGYEIALDMDEIARNNEFLHSLVGALIQIHFHVEFDETTFKLRLKSVKAVVDEQKVDRFAPLSFVDFDSEKQLVSKKFRIINSRHWLGQWLIINQDELLENYEGYFDGLMKHILGHNIDAVNALLKQFQKIFFDDNAIRQTIEQSDMPPLDEDDENPFSRIFRTHSTPPL